MRQPLSNLDITELESTLRPELLDRIDDVVLFRPLGEREIERIVELQVEALAERLAAQSVHLDLSERARRFLADQAIAQGGGGRYVARTIARHVTTPLSEALLRGRLAGGHTARVDVSAGAITVDSSA
jgi:ATP-dependent Clp protease ATP-binding subunit ClpB